MQSSGFKLIQMCFIFRLTRHFMILRIRRYRIVTPLRLLRVDTNKTQKFTKRSTLIFFVCCKNTKTIDDLKVNTIHCMVNGEDTKNTIYSRDQDYPNHQSILTTSFTHEETSKQNVTYIKRIPANLCSDIYKQFLNILSQN